MISTAICHANLDHYLKGIDKKIETTSIDLIDCTYLINLESRNERFMACMQKLTPFGIMPQRFSAIYGWSLTQSEYNGVGLTFQPGMWNGKEPVQIEAANGTKYVTLSSDCYGETVFSGWLTPGAVGCTLSHLSVLKDAEMNGYETIWVLEDDIEIYEDPHLISPLIKKLNEFTGPDGWDILYTDPDYLCGIDETKDLQEQLPMKWRPDMPDIDLKSLIGRTEIGEDFYKINSRMRTHSMIISKSGIAKILNFYRENFIFLPYDHELSLIPEIRLFGTKIEFVNCKENDSDTRSRFF